MHVKDFVSSIYLGDRACKQISIDSWEQELSIEVDTISRIRSDDGNWNFNNGEDVENGQLVFGNVKNIFFDEHGNIPNDQINYFDVDEQEDGSFCFKLSIDSVSDDGSNTEVIIKIIADSLSIRDPLNPEVLIVD